EFMGNSKVRGSMTDFSSVSVALSRLTQSQETRLPRWQQSSPQQIQIRQRKGREQPRGVLRQSPIAHFAEPPQALHHMEGMLAAGARLGANSVDPLLLFAEGLMLGGRTVVAIAT